MHNIIITVDDKRRAEAPQSAQIVADNNDCVIIFDIAEGSGFDTGAEMTAVLVTLQGKLPDITFTGGQITVPRLTAADGGLLYVGLTQGDIKTTEAARVRVLPSVYTYAQGRLAPDPSNPQPYDAIPEATEVALGDEVIVNDVRAGKRVRATLEQILELGGGGGAGVDGHSPYIGSNGYWYAWNDDTQEWYNTNVKAEGQDGEDGYSPTASVTESGGVVTITITDKSGTTSATVPTELLMATYGVTTYNAIAMVRNKPVFCRYDGALYVLRDVDADKCTFATVQSGHEVRVLTVSDADVWATATETDLQMVEVTTTTPLATIQALIAAGKMPYMIYLNRYAHLAKSQGDDVIFELFDEQYMMHIVLERDGDAEWVESEHRVLPASGYTAGAVLVTNQYGGVTTEPRSSFYTPKVTVSSVGAVTQALDAGKVYEFTGAVTSLTLTFNAPASGRLAQYHFVFTEPSTAFDPTLPNGVVLPDSHTWEADTRYEVDILDGYAVVVGWEVTS